MADDLERTLRGALQEEAEQVQPHERIAEILALAHEDDPVVEPQRRWLLPVGAAASVALIGAVIWGVSSAGGSQQAALSATHPDRSVSTPLPARTGTGNGSGTGSGTGSDAGADTDTDTGDQEAAPATAPDPSPAAISNGRLAAAPTQVTLPAYFVGASSAAGKRFGLYQELVRIAVPVGAGTALKAKAAVAVAMNAQPFTRYEPYLQPWSHTSVTKLTVAPNQITITLSGPGAQGFTAAQTRLAVQELVWTAQAAAGQGSTPVRFAIANGVPTLFGTYPTQRSYNRPPKDLEYEVLAPIWVISPVRDQAFPAGAAVVASGQSCAFEGTTQWRLEKGTAIVRSGVTTASSGCPTRGAWQVKLGVLATGGYTFRMYEVSMADGQAVAETSKPFTVQ